MIIIGNEYLGYTWYVIVIKLLSSVFSFQILKFGSNFSFVTSGIMMIGIEGSFFLGSLFSGSSAIQCFIHIVIHMIVIIQMSFG